MDKILNILPYTSLNNTWDINRVFQDEQYEGMVPLYSILKQYQISISKEEAIARHLHIISKITFGGILYLNDFEKIYSVKGTLYEIPRGALTYSKINVRHGCSYLNNTNNSILASSEYPSFIVDENKVYPKYLIMVLRCPQILKQFNSKLRGFTKSRVSVSEFLSTKIPLPSIEKQKELVRKYEETLKIAIQKAEESDKLENSIDDYLLSELGINNIDEQSKENKLFSIVTYKQLQNAWQLQVEQIDNEKEIMLQDACIFVKRTWTKKDRPYFNYIEINSINKNQEIEHTNTIDTRKAPSRATQIVYKGDLIIATTRPYLKKFAIVSEKNNNDICSSGFQILNAKKEFNIEFVKLFLSSSVGISRLSQKMTGALYPAINTSDLKKIYIPNLPCIEQNKIVEHISEYKNKVKNLMRESEQLKQQAISNFEQEVFN